MLKIGVWCVMGRRTPKGWVGIVFLFVGFSFDYERERMEIKKLTE
jgi:hypothetical protein